MFFRSADDAAPQRTASRKASSLSGGSKPVGSGNDPFSMILAPGSISQMTCSSSPRPSSEREKQCSLVPPFPEEFSTAASLLA